MEAILYQTGSKNEIQCALCAHRCVVKEGKRGICGVRENQQGKLISLVYGKVIAQHVDPIEKKPLFHFLPGSRSYSIATAGCNFKCRFCQNAEIAHLPLSYPGSVMAGEDVSAEEVVRKALLSECHSIAYTYTEPTVFLEFALDVMKIAKANGIRNVFVTNGYMTEEALNAVLPFLDAANVDLKAFRAEFYQSICRAKLDPVKETLRRMHEKGIWLEVTTLLIPGLNDGSDEIYELTDFIANHIGVDVPWHISRFHPDYKMLDRPITSVESLKTARDIGLSSGLRYVYIGNVTGESGENTFCWACGKLLIERWGFQLLQNRIVDERCPDCGQTIDGVFH
jgi:pyruvate formate lyase activating enzyme